VYAGVLLWNKSTQRLPKADTGLNLYLERRLERVSEPWPGEDPGRESLQNCDGGGERDRVLRRPREWDGI
jgi:hypothetical protein